MKRIKLINTAFIALMVLLFIACETKEDTNEFNLNDEVLVTIKPIQKEAGSTIVESSGLFTTDDETLLSFKNGGLIERIYVKEGDYVKKGQVLASLNMTELNAKAAQLKAALEKAERDFTRAQKLYKDSVATLEQFQNAQTQLDVIKQDWNTIEFNLKYSQIRANGDGYILLKLANEGQMVGPGMPVFQMNSAGNGNWMVKVGVSDFQWASIAVGDSAIITTDAYPKEIKARIIQKSEGINPNSGTFTLSVQPISMKGLTVASGMFAKVKIFGNAKDTWFVPYEALLNGNKGKGYVFVTDDKKKAKKVQVYVAALQTDYVMIRSGLENYRYLIVSGSPYLKDGSDIKVVD
ncbi:MAG: efflux RND transporter periplasmic adaptor subunit [Crocinitomicaceae bacterium]|nr:efflux RND transporter periplasmic adaptor subunit [Crocinitomicaceae bacterium]